MEAEIDYSKLLKACFVKLIVSLFTKGQEKVEVGVKQKSELNAEFEKSIKKKKQ